MYKRKRRKEQRNKQNKDLVLAEKYFMK